MNVAFVGGWPAEGRQAEGGVEVATTRLAAALADRGVGVTVLAPGSGAPQFDAGVRVVRVPVRGNGRLLLLRRLRPWRAAVAHALQDFDVDVDLVHGHGLLDGGLPAVDASLPSVVTAHGSHAMDTRAARSSVGGELRIAVGRSLARDVVRRAGAVISVNPDPGVNLPGVPRRFEYIPSIVAEPFRAADPKPIPGRILYCGGPRRIKGLDLLAAAWPAISADAPESTLHVAGWPRGTALPAELGAASCDPWLTAEGLADAMAKASVVVIPSRFEVSPVTLLEAWSVGVPVVATRVGGLAGLAEGGAVMVAAEPAAIAAGVLGALSGSDSAALVAEGRRRAELARPESVTRAHITLYEELLG